MLNLRGLVRISGSIKRTSRLSTKCAISLLRTAHYTNGAMAAKIQGTCNLCTVKCGRFVLPQPRGANVSPFFGLSSLRRE